MMKEETGLTEEEKEEEEKEVENWEASVFVGVRLPG